MPVALRSCLAALAIATPSGSVHAQSLTIGEIAVRPGANATEVIALLRSRYHVVRVAEKDRELLWQVADKPFSQGGRALGSLWTASDVVESVTQHSGPFTFLDAATVYDVWLSRLKELGGAQCADAPSTYRMQVSFATRCGLYTLTFEMPYGLEGRLIKEQPSLSLSVRR